MKMCRLFVAFTLICFALSPSAHAVVPPPDGAYSNFTTAEGQNALQSLTTGVANTALGAYSLFSTIDKSFNTAVGAGALDLNNGDSNTAVGAAALLVNTSGIENTAIGTAALEFNDTGSGNAATGALALSSNSTGSFNTAIGHLALSSNTIGSSNMAVGESALLVNTTGDGNVAIGVSALRNNNASENVAIGHNAGLNMTEGSHTVLIGTSAGANIQKAFNVICIGEAAGGANVSGTCFIGNIVGITTQHNDAVPVVIDSAGQLGTASSSRRYKTDIKTMDKASESILALKPVSFRYKIHKDTTPQFGLIAEDVAEVNPSLVIYDADGKPYTVRYDAVNAMLLNEFLKEHKKVEQLQSTVTQQQKDFQAIVGWQQKQIEALTAGLQKVSVQLELSKAAPQTVLNTH
jgi:Chaperone of endosialidase